MPLPQQFLDELIARSDIVDVVSESVPLKKRGKDYWACCPFHSEKTPSFSVSPERQIYKCFGCGKGGGVINFVMEMEHLPYREAVEVLARRAGMAMPEYSGAGGASRNRREKILKINVKAARIFHRWLQGPEGKKGLDYLRGRGLSNATLTRFGLGFAPNRWDGLIEAMGKEGYDKRDLLDAGLVVSNREGRIYDRFRNRVIFPIIDIRGDVIGFGGRVMDDSTPKYLNSPDTPVYNKSRNLFALNLAKKTKAGRVILTEGYMDTIALHQAGFDCAVASLGTSLTEEHGQLLSRFFHDAIISYDGDRAGIAAAQRAIPILERAGLRVRVLQVTDAKDPDEYIRKFGARAFSQLLDRSENQVDYRLGQLQKQFDLTDDSQRVLFLQEAAALLATLPSAVEREIFGTHAARMAGVSPEVMAQEVRRSFRERMRRENQKTQRQEMNPASQIQPRSRALRYGDLRSARAEETLLCLAMTDPSLLGQMEGLTGEAFSSPLLGRVFDLVRMRADLGLSTQPAALAGDLTEEEMSHLVQVATLPMDLSRSEQAIRDCLEVIREQNLRRSSPEGGELLQSVQQDLMKRKAWRPPEE